jgi:cardiolipin synthase
VDAYQHPFESATGRAFQPGNHVTLLQNGVEIFPAMLEAIRGARASVDFCTYVLWRSRIASEFADALCERAKAGVTVRLLVDAVGGAVMSTRTVAQLERAGVRIAWFRPLRPGHLRLANHRTHRKILLIDGHTGFTGGVGIADEWDGNADHAKHWRETHCRITGPACAQLFAGFADNWLAATHEHLAAPPVPKPTGHTAILSTASSVGARPTSIERLFETAVTIARERLWITSAYFVPSPALIAGLIAAAGRGVDVRVITNGPFTNHKITWRAGQATYMQLAEAGVKIYEYQPTVLHAKVMTVDHAWATLGSANFDDRSLVLNDEFNISVTDPDIVAALDQQFWRDLERSQHMRMAILHRRPWHHRLIIAGSSVFSRQL